MNKFNVVTTFHEKYYNLYAKQMLESFAKFWPATVHLHVYYQGKKPGVIANNIYYYNFDELCINFAEFKARNSYKQDSNTPFRMDAIKFAHKPYAIFKQNENNNSQYLIWCDADTITTKPITIKWLKTLVHRKAYISCLIRGNGDSAGKGYTECGFYIMDTQHKQHNKFISIFEAMYNEDLLYNEREYHDSWIFDRVMYPMIHAREIRVVNLSGPGSHSFVTGPLGKYLDHLKGKRKEKGFSPERGNR